MMALMSGMVVPQLSVRKQIVAAIHLLIQVARLSDGTRRVIKIVEITGMEVEVVSMQDVFNFEATGTDAEGRIIGGLHPRAARPRLLKQMDEAEIAYPSSVAAVWPQPVRAASKRKGREHRKRPRRTAQAVDRRSV
jgi:pilus assembly protein CpaF